MARTDNIANFCTDIAEAIREKTGTTEQIPAVEFDNKINEINAGIDIDGIIKEYEIASNGNVNAGDFVKYITEHRNNKCNI